MDNQQARLEDLFEIPFLENYFHDGNGGIYSSNRSKNPREMKKIISKGKTRKVYYRVKVAGRLWMVHHLVAMHKYQRKLTNGESVNHINGDTEDNRPENLEISTHAEQVAHAVRTGLYCSGLDWRKARGFQ